MLGCGFVEVVVIIEVAVIVVAATSPIEVAVVVVVLVNIVVNLPLEVGALLFTMGLVLLAMLMIPMSAHDLVSNCGPQDGDVSAMTCLHC